MKITKINVSVYKTNCYILSIGNDSLVIDPGDDFPKIEKAIGNKNVLGAIVTHSHPDHNGAVNHFENIYDYNNLKDIENGEMVDVKDYLKDEKVDYSNGVTKIGNKISSSVSDIMTNGISGIFDALKGLFW